MSTGTCRRRRYFQCNWMRCGITFPSVWCAEKLLISLLLQKIWNKHFSSTSSWVRCVNVTITRRRVGKSYERTHHRPSKGNQMKILLRQYVRGSHGKKYKADTKIPSLYLLAGNVPRSRKSRERRKHPESDCCTSVECFCVHSLLVASSHSAGIGGNIKQAKTSEICKWCSWIISF